MRNTVLPSLKCESIKFIKRHCKTDYSIFFKIFPVRWRKKYRPFLFHKLTEQIIRFLFQLHKKKQKQKNRRIIHPLISQWTDNCLAINLRGQILMNSLQKADQLNKKSIRTLPPRNTPKSFINENMFNMKKGK